MYDCPSKLKLCPLHFLSLCITYISEAMYENGFLPALWESLPALVIIIITLWGCLLLWFHNYAKYFRTFLLLTLMIHWNIFAPWPLYFLGQYWNIHLYITYISKYFKICITPLFLRLSKNKKNSNVFLMKTLEMFFSCQNLKLLYLKNEIIGLYYLFSYL